MKFQTELFVGNHSFVSAELLSAFLPHYVPSICCISLLDSYCDYFSISNTYLFSQSNIELGKILKFSNIWFKYHFEHIRIYIGGGEGVYVLPAHKYCFNPNRYFCWFPLGGYWKFDTFNRKYTIWEKV